MALIITKDVSVLGGIVLNQLYLRIDYKADVFGKNLNCETFVYYNKEAFLGNWQENIVKINGLPSNYSFACDTSVNSNPLLYLHEKIKEKLSTDVTILVPVTDPSTLEESWEEVVAKPKFANSEDIIFVDLD
jgi:hypothetical protein